MERFLFHELFLPKYITHIAYFSNQIVILLLLQMVLFFIHDIEMGAPHAKEII